MATMSINLILLLSLLLLVSMTEGGLLGLGSPHAEPTPECEEVFGVRNGDTCLAVTQMFNVTGEAFSAINPNLNCDNLFVGQWLCVAGIV